MLAPILKQVKDELGEAVNIVKIDVDKNPAIASKFHVIGVLTIVLFKNGKQLWRKSGILQMNAILQIVKSHS